MELIAITSSKHKIRNAPIVGSASNCIPYVDEGLTRNSAPTIGKSNLPSRPLIGSGSVRLPTNCGPSRTFERLHPKRFRLKILRMRTCRTGEVQWWVAGGKERVNYSRAPKVGHYLRIISRKINIYDEQTPTRLSLLYISAVIRLLCTRFGKYVFARSRIILSAMELSRSKYEF